MGFYACILVLPFYYNVLTSEDSGTKSLSLSLDIYIIFPIMVSGQLVHYLGESKVSYGRLTERREVFQGAM